MFVSKSFFSAPVWPRNILYASPAPKEMIQTPNYCVVLKKIPYAELIRTRYPEPYPEPYPALSSLIRTLSDLIRSLMWISLAQVLKLGEAGVTECSPSQAKTLSVLIRFRSLSQGVLSGLIRDSFCWDFF